MKPGIGSDPPQIEGLGEGKLVLAGPAAEVYSFIDTHSSRPIQVKLSVASAGFDAAGRIDREARILGKLAGLGGVPVKLGAGRLGDGRSFLTTHHLDGPALAELIRRGPLSWEAAARLIIALGEVLGPVHLRGVAHLALGPTTVQITSSGLVISDFSDAAELGTTLEVAKADAPFAAPELLAGRGLADQRADVYAAAALLCALVSGRAPYQGKQPRHGVAAEDSHTTAAAGPVAAVAGLPAVLQAILAKSLSADAGARHATIAHLTGDLAGVLALPDGPVVAGRPGPAASSQDPDLAPAKSELAAKAQSALAESEPARAAALGELDQADSPQPAPAPARPALVLPPPLAPVLIRPELPAHLAPAAASNPPTPTTAKLAPAPLPLPVGLPRLVPPPNWAVPVSAQPPKAKVAKVLPAVNTRSAPRPSGADADGAQALGAALRPAFLPVRPTGRRDLLRAGETASGKAGGAKRRPKVGPSRGHLGSQSRGRPGGQAQDQGQNRSGPSMAKGSRIAVSLAASLSLLAGGGAAWRLGGRVPNDAIATTFTPVEVKSQQAPSPENGLATVDAGGQMVFTWDNPAPQAGDFYDWVLLGEGTMAQHNAVTTNRLVIPAPESGEVICIEVKLVRLGGQTSEVGLQVCA
ncbi:MAG: hypothetical protein FWD29_07915 [Micrococcales bacterium]|nr:hypothetical protein [Micrococcales bacterium]